MTIIHRKQPLERLISMMHNGRIKIITGIRRCGKSFLLSRLFKDHLHQQGVGDDQIIEIALDKKQYEAMRNPNTLYQYVVEKIEGQDKQFYLFIDEIQLSYKIKRLDVDESQVPEEDRELLYTTFYDILNDLMTWRSLDIYVTGSNSKMLSKDVATNFRDRGIEIRLHPFSFAEFYSISDMEKADAWEEYLVYGGMPLAVLEKNPREREAYLISLFERVYVADIVERYGVAESYVDDLLDVLASNIGSLTNPSKLAKTLNSVRRASTTDKTVKKYLDAFEDAFLFTKARRYDVKGKAYFDSPVKYYAEDVGLRNARLNFRQIEETHLMENILYNELVLRGFAVDVGSVRFAKTVDGKLLPERWHEIDFVVNSGSQKVYIQSAFSIHDEDKHQQEILPLLKSGDSFRKLVVIGGNKKMHTDENGISYIGVIPFLLEEIDNLL
ncbi:MAG: ATP-binding protein [Christensenellales bacterium]|jgi:predicted AAA+ superfamily ATPase|nr:ATP-binding protein [Clostridiales bacterium]